MTEKHHSQDHYATGSIECIEVIEDQGWLVPFCLANVTKYALRCQHKGTMLEDLEKIKQYAEFLIDHLTTGSVRPDTVLVRMKAPTEEAKERLRGHLKPTADYLPTVIQDPPGCCDGRFTFTATEDIDPGEQYKTPEGGER